MKYVFMGLIRLYQWTISPLLGPVCRYHPSCSRYGYEAMRVHGAAKGTALTVWRLLRCNPWSRGGYDPAPPHGQWRPEPDETSTVADDAPGQERTAREGGASRADGGQNRTGMIRTRRAPNRSGTPTTVQGA